MTCFLVHHHPRQGGVGAVAALGTAAGRGKSGPRSSALQRTSEVRLGTPCRGAAQSQNRGDFAEQRSQGEAALVGHFVFLFFFWDDFGMDLELVVIFFFEFEKGPSNGSASTKFSGAACAANNHHPYHSSGSSITTTRSEPFSQKAQVRQWQWNDSRISVGVHPKGCPNYEDFKKNPPNKSDFHRKSRDLV